MKKILACTICLFAIASANSAFAGFTASPRDLGTEAAGSTGSGITAANNPKLTQQLSTNVLMDYISATDGAGYIVGTFHNKGTRTYGSSSGDTQIFSAVITTTGTGIALPTTAPTGTASAAFTSTWTAL